MPCSAYADAWCEQRAAGGGQGVLRAAEVASENSGAPTAPAAGRSPDGHTPALPPKGRDGESPAWSPQLPGKNPRPAGPLQRGGDWRPWPWGPARRQRPVPALVMEE